MKLTSATYKKWKKIENEIIEKNKAKGVYYHEEIWLSKYTPEMLCELAGITNEKGAERTRKIAEALAKLDGVTVETKNDGTCSSEGNCKIKDFLGTHPLFIKSVTILLSFMFT